MDAGHFSMADITGPISAELAAKGVNYYAHTNSLLTNFFMYTNLALLQILVTNYESSCFGDCMG